MDKLIREALHDKANEITVPSGAWEQVRQAIRPALRPRFWQRYRLGDRLELVAAVAVLLLFVAAAALGPALNHGASANQLLSPFDYRLVQSPGGSIAIYHGDELVLGGVSHVSPVTVSQRQDNFLFLASIAADRYWLVQADGVQEWDPVEVMRHRFLPPVYVANELVSVQWDDATNAYAVWRGGQRIFTPPLRPQPFGNEVKRLASWSGHWVLEFDGDVYIDGNSLSKPRGHDEVFGWRLLDGRPFYFFRQRSHIGIAYDGRERRRYRLRGLS